MVGKETWSLYGNWNGKHAYCYRLNSAQQTLPACFVFVPVLPPQIVRKVQQKEIEIAAIKVW